MQAVGAATFWMNDPPAVEPLRLRRVPMLLAAFCFAAGELLARNWQPARLLVLCAAILFLLAAIALRFAPRIVLVPVFALWCIAGCWCAQIEPAVPTHPVLLTYADGLSRIVRGRIVRIRSLPALEAAPETQQLAPWQIEPGGWETDTSSSRQSIDLDIAAVEDITPDLATMRPLAGGVRVLLTGSALPLRCGDVLELPLRLRTPDVYRDPGAFSYSEQLLSEGIDLTATAHSERVRRIGGSTSNLRCRLYAAQSWASTGLDAFLGSRANALLHSPLRLDHKDTAMLRAMLFGDRTYLNASLREAFQRTGTFHLFIVSGLHIVLLAGAIFWLLRRVRLPEGLSVMLTIAIALAYTLLTGFGAPSRRALLMASLYLLARWLDRETSALNALGFAACAVLALDPRSLYEPGFQMTFLVVAAIAGIASPTIERFVRPRARALRLLDVAAIDAHIHPHLAQFRVHVRMSRELAGSLLGKPLRNAPVWLLMLAFHLVDALILSLAIELCMALPMAVYFHRATLLALPLNLINVPLLALLLASSVAMFCAALLSPWLAMLPAALTALLLHTMRFAIAHLQRAPLADIRLPQPTAAALLGAGFAIAIACILLRMRSRVALAFGCVLALLVPLAAVYPAAPLLHSGVLEVTSLDVGQGDSLLVVSPEGKTMLVDAGGPVGRTANAASTGWDIGEEVVAPYLWSRRIRRLDVVVLTHAHSDHMGGMSAVLRDLRPRELWLGIEPKNSPGLQALLVEADRLHIAVRRFHAGDIFHWGSVQTSVLAPESGYVNDNVPANDDSLVLRLDFGNASALLEGDAERRSEDTMLERKRLAPTTLLKVGHHGSKTSTNPEFLNAVTPRFAVISVGRHNTFGHPRSEVLARLEAAHVRTFRTDRFGASTFLLRRDGSVVEFSAERTN